MTNQTLSPEVQKELCSPVKAQPTGGKSKACLFNLIVYSHEPRRTQYLKDIVQMIMSQFPCRIIFIQANPEAKQDLLNVVVSSEKTKDERGLVCDQILIEASGKEINKVNFLLLPLFTPDLPIYLLWGQDPCLENTILPHLQHFATRLIIDPESTDDLQQFCRDIQNRMSSTSTQIVDMNWARIGGWREVIAQVFDSPERFQQLTDVEKVEIIYNDRPSDLFVHPNTQAIYLQAWLASRLGWEYKSSERIEHAQRIFYHSGTLNRQITLIPKTSQEFQAEEIMEFHTLGSDNECHLKRIAMDQVQVHSSNQFQCQLPFTLIMPTLRSGRSFMQEIFFQKVSAHYVPMLDLISLVKWS